jgi:U3 small nucleolar RNA-associated protein 20
VRDLCSQALLQFLLDYPLGEKRLQQHLEFLLTNVQQYEHETGRLSALSFLQVLAQKLPQQVIQVRAWTVACSTVRVC